MGGDEEFGLCPECGYPLAECEDPNCPCRHGIQCHVCVAMLDAARGRRWFTALHAQWEQDQKHRRDILRGNL